MVLQIKSHHLTIFNAVDNVERRQVDLLPRGSAFVNDEEYLTILRDLLNLNTVLDDMEQSGMVPYSSRGHYYNAYSAIYRLLISKSKAAAQ